nr:MAG TPA: hypothetical protein [Caudoviricetes sp.]DAV27883.1 MAG TPA: hypothetical protein [Caudoviricetes sp.]
MGGDPVTRRNGWASPGIATEQQGEAQQRKGHGSFRKATEMRGYAVPRQGWAQQ